MVRKVKPPEPLSDLDKSILVMEALVQRFQLDGERERVIASHFRPQYLEKLKTRQEHDGIMLFHYVTPHEHEADICEENVEYLTKAIAMLKQLRQMQE